MTITARPRPDTTRGTTDRVKTGCGNFYITVNWGEMGVCEVFAQMGKAGGCVCAQTEAICRLASLALRGGLGVEKVVQQLVGIQCPLPMWENGVQVVSCADAVAKVLQKRAKKGDEDGNGEDDGNGPPTGK